MILRLILVIAAAALLAVMAAALIDDPPCPAGLSGPAALPWLRDMQQQMCVRK